MMQTLEVSLKKEKAPPIDWNTFNLKECTRCTLCSGRKNVIMPEVVQGSRVLLIGDVPTAQEDIYGVPFVGESGQLLTKIMEHEKKNRFV